jgi:hypothetical protein
MSNLIRIFLNFIYPFIFSKDLPGQNLQDSLYHAIPIEAYEGFDRDTFTLFGESEPRQLVKVGVYKSIVKVHLEGVGEVYVHHV